MRHALPSFLAFFSLALPLRGAEVDYLRDVKPILERRCSSCHGALSQKAKLRLDASSLIRKGGKHGPVVVAGKADESLLMEAVIGATRSRMPPEAEGAALSARELAVLKDWINQGARMPDEPIPPDPRAHWAFQPPVRSPLPQSVRAGATSNPVDAFLAAGWATHRLTPNAPAEKAVLLRRVYLDLIGLPPSSEDIANFVADNSADAYEKVVDRLLASPRYGERWGRHWMDIWRYSDPFGLGEEYRYSQRHIWHWRDWIIESLNADKGYDRMVVEMLAGDEVAPGDANTLRATGYLARNWYKFNRNVWIQDTVEYTAAGFLGLTMRCARCHNHKYDPIKQEDYYHLRAFFEPHDVRIDPMPGQPDLLKDGVARVFDAKPSAPTYRLERGDERMPDRSKTLEPNVPAVLGELGGPIQEIRVTARDYAEALKVAILAERNAAQATLAAADAAVKRASETLASARLQSDMKAQARAEAMLRLAEKQREAARSVRIALEARIVAEQMVHGNPPADSGHRKTLIVLAGAAERQAALTQAELAVLQAEQALSDARHAQTPGAAKMLMTAEKNLKAAQKNQATAAAALNLEATTYTPLVRFPAEVSTGRRLALARWITDRKNPLTARVAVNHIWMRHFGTPLVASVANFGLSGKKPTHPELLDWLAIEFMETGWSMKRLHRLLVTSEAYRLSSRDDNAANAAIDPQNQYRWRMATRRMEAEVVRDSILAVAGELDTTMGGPILSEKLGEASRRRSLYFRLNTEYKMCFLDQFDVASPTECYERRESVVPQQALALANSALVLNQARVVARKLGPAEPEVFAQRAFKRVLGRLPTEKERMRCERFLREQTALFQSQAKFASFSPGPEGVTPPAADPAQRAREDLIHVLFTHSDFITIH